MLYHSALEQPPSGRGVYLEEACGGDEELRKLVVSLLEQGDVSDSPLERPAVGSGRFGPYILGEKLGSGGMGEVYKAYDPRLNRTVAIKVLKSPFTNPFQREARAIAALNHPHICTLYDIGPYYLVMEHVEGKPLCGPLPLEKVLEYTRQICEALTAAHRAGIVHRDLKPANILVTKLGIKLLDFGIARVMQEGATMSSPGVVMGTPAYMAPEVLQGAPADARSDIYSLGWVVQEMMTGSRAAQRTLDPPELDRVVRTCRVDDPDERWQSAREVNLALELVRQPTTAHRQKRSALVWAGLALIVALFFVLLISMQLRHEERAEFPYRIRIDPPEGYEFKQAQEWEVVQAGEQILKNSGADISHDQRDRAFYNRATDSIHLPARHAFSNPADYYGTALHELAHWAGHPTRLNRPTLNESYKFGDPSYAKEELRAELTSLFLAGERGIPHNPEEHAAYVAAWVSSLREDKNEIFRAGKDAHRATDFLLALEKEKAVDKALELVNRPMGDAAGDQLPKGEERQLRRETSEHVAAFEPGSGTVDLVDKETATEQRASTATGRLESSERLASAG
jgi:serine/threonine protein kinase